MREGDVVVMAVGGMDAPVYDMELWSQYLRRVEIFATEYLTELSFCL